MKINEHRFFKYGATYLKWAKLANKLGYSCVTEMFEQLYNNPPRTLEEVGFLTGITSMGVYKMMKKLGIVRRKSVSKRPELFYGNKEDKGGRRR